MKNLLTKGALWAASSLLALAISILALVGGDQSAPNKPLAGATNYDELALNDVKAYKPFKVSIQSDSTSINAYAQNTDPFTRWIEVNSLHTSGTTTLAGLRVTGTTTTTPNTVGTLSNVTLPTLFDFTIATGSPAQALVGSSTPYRLVPWPAGQYVELNIRSISASSFGAGTATNTLRNLGNLDWFLDTWASSTVR